MSAACASSLSPPPTTFNASTVSSSRKRSVRFVTGLNSFGGLKAQNNIVCTLGLPVCADQGFARVMSEVRYGKGRGGGGGALSSTCNAVAEIFKIAAIMNGLTLVGVAVGFVLLKMEAAVEEADT